MRAALLVLAFAVGLQAQTPKVAADYTYPSGTDAPLNASILIRATCCGQPTLTVRANGQNIPGRLQMATLLWYVFTPDQRFLPSTVYSVVFSAPSMRDFTGSFTTGSTVDTTPLRVASTIPADG